MSIWYILDADHNPIPASMEEAGEWFEQIERRRVGIEEVGEWEVSTIFLIIDHQHGKGPPILFETMVFPRDSRDAALCWRYSTWTKAEAGHARIVAALKAGKAPEEIEETP